MRLLNITILLITYTKLATHAQMITASAEVQMPESFVGTSRNSDDTVRAQLHGPILLGHPNVS